MRIENGTRGTVVCDRGRRANTFLSRAVGLLGRRGLEPGEGLLIEPCSSIHMFFMRFPIDVAYVDREGIVVKTVRGLRPWRISAARRARSTLELPAGTLDASGTVAGDVLVFRD